MRISACTICVSLLFLVGGVALSLIMPDRWRVDDRLFGQETNRSRGEIASRESPSGAFPPSLLDSIRGQIDPHQPRRLQLLLMKPEVQEALEIDRDTYRLVSEALSDIMKKQLEMSKELGAAASTNDAEAIRTRMEKFRAIQTEREQATRDALTEIFPPKSFERLKQIALQIQIREAGLGNVLVHGILADKLAFSEAQLETLTVRARELEQEKQDKIRQLIEEYDAKLLAYVTPAQRQEFQQHVGEQFAYTPLSREAESFQRLKELGQRLNPQPEE